MTNEQQLSLLPDHDVPLRFRLDDATVRRGRRHIAAIRKMLRDQGSDDTEHPPVPSRSGRAA